MCIVTEDVIGKIVGACGETVFVLYNSGQRVQSGSLTRTVFYGSIRCSERDRLNIGDEVLCQIQRVCSHNDEPLLAIRRIPEIN